jgi:hypothetical protein
MTSKRRNLPQDDFCSVREALKGPALWRVRREIISVGAAESAYVQNRTRKFLEKTHLTPNRKGDVKLGRRRDRRFHDIRSKYAVSK